MARDFENIHDIEDLSDGELKDLVLEHLAENRALDVNDINAHVEKGRVRLIGRVGTEAEWRIAERELTDVLGLTNVSNELVVDPIRRAESPAAIDDHLADEAERENLMLGDMAVPLAPEVEQVEEDLDARLYGTADVQKAIAQGTPWIPPNSPSPEGVFGPDAPPSTMNEEH
jgi:hypothetical protein